MRPTVQRWKCTGIRANWLCYTSTEILDYRIFLFFIWWMPISLTQPQPVSWELPFTAVVWEPITLLVKRHFLWIHYNGQVSCFNICGIRLQMGKNESKYLLCSSNLREKHDIVEWTQAWEPAPPAFWSWPQHPFPSVVLGPILLISCLNLHIWSLGKKKTYICVSFGGDERIELVNVWKHFDDVKPLLLSFSTCTPLKNSALLLENPSDEKCLLKGCLSRHPLFYELEMCLNGF